MFGYHYEETMSEVAVASATTEPPPPADAEDSKPAATETPLSPSSVEHRYERARDGDADDDDIPKEEDGADEEGAKEEDELFTSIEKEHEGEESGEQPKEVTAAPRLLQKALTAGEVKEELSDEEKKESSEGEAEGGKNDESEKPHVHQRVSFLPAARQSCRFARHRDPITVSLLFLV